MSNALNFIENEIITHSNASGVKLNCLKINSSVYNAEYQGNSNLNSVSVSSTATSIGDSAFHGCNNLDYVGFDSPSKINKIGGKAFANTLLERFEMPSSVTEVGAGAFANCNYLYKVKWSKNCKTIPHNAFLNCRGLTNFHVPEGVEYISNGAFEGCENLAFVFLPDSIISISPTAFPPGIKIHTSSNIHWKDAVNWDGSPSKKLNDLRKINDAKREANRQKTEPQPEDFQPKKAI
ncbi:MAG: leucine-rich repeat domain-containing protein [Clostridiales bacterium]|jgi:hypothetical protein|nr:leucine-rich repeat domain-containing protein [Clostridiales bacterium]